MKSSDSWPTNDHLAQELSRAWFRAVTKHAWPIHSQPGCFWIWDNHLSLGAMHFTLCVLWVTSCDFAVKFIFPSFDSVEIWHHFRTRKRFRPSLPAHVGRWQEPPSIFPKRPWIRTPHVQVKCSCFRPHVFHTPNHTHKLRTHQFPKMMWPLQIKGSPIYHPGLNGHGVDFLLKLMNPLIYHSGWWVLVANRTAGSWTYLLVLSRGCVSLSPSSNADICKREGFGKSKHLDE